jgi:hypothetical protein
MTALRVAATVAIYCVVVGWLTWPLAAHLTTHLPHTKFVCDFDLPQMLWALSWQTHALLTSPSRLFEANIYHPARHALLYADAGVGALPYFAPTYLATGNPVLASNLMFLVCVAATAAAIHLLVGRWTGLASAGAVAASVFLLTPWVLRSWIPAVPNYAVLQLVPVIVYLVAQRELSPRQLWLLAAMLVLEGAANPYTGAAAMAPVVLLACVRLGSRSTLPAALRALAAVALASLALAVVYAPYAWLRLEVPHLDQQSPWMADRLRPRLVAMDVPRELFWDADRPSAVPFKILGLIGVGWLASWLPRAGRSDGERIAWRHGWIWATIGLLLLLTSNVEVFGVPFRLPLAGVLDQVPVVNVLRDSHRIGIGALFGFAILAGVAFTEYVRWLERVLPRLRPVTLHAVAAVVIVAAIGPAALPGSPPYPLAAAGVPHSAVTDVLRRPGGPVLQLPVDAPFPRRFAVHARAMFESIGRWRPLLNGYGGFYPAEFPDRMALATRLPDAAALAELRRATGLELILVRGGIPPKRRQWKRLARRGGGEGLRFVARDGQDLLFAVSDERAMAAHD